MTLRAGQILGAQGLVQHFLRAIMGHRAGRRLLCDPNCQACPAALSADGKEVSSLSLGSCRASSGFHSHGRLAMVHQGLSLVCKSSTAIWSLWPPLMA